MSKRDRYAEAGVDVEAGYQAVQQMKKHVARTNRPEIMSDLGGFGSLFALDKDKYERPVLVSGTDGVGTKLLIAQELKRYDTIGIDAVAMCVNDIITVGAEPLFFLDYLAVGENDPDRIEKLVSGISEGCVQAGAALIGGETAEMPDVYPALGFDIAGFAVGVVDADEALRPEQVVPGDVLIGLPSSGLHSNGYSLVRQILFKDHQCQYDESLPSGRALGEALLEPTRIYVKPTLKALKTGAIHGISHITGGGFDENIPRMLPEGLGVDIDRSVIERPEIFTYLQDLGDLSDDEMFAIFNMGIGLVYAVDKDRADEVLEVLQEAGEKPVRLGVVTAGD